MNNVEESMARLDAKLEGMPFDFAFLGGAVLALLVTDKSVDAIRVTKDFDVMMNIRTRREYHVADAELEKRGFQHDTREDAPVCRWIVDDVTVDVLPIREDVLGWRSTWFEEALTAADTIDLGNRHVRIVSAPYFVALKLEAFEQRGRKDFLTSTDFEDVICLFNGRDGIVEEILACERLRGVLSLKFKEYLTVPELEDAVDGFLQTETEPEVRKTRIFNAFRAIANIVDH